MNDACAPNVGGELHHLLLHALVRRVARVLVGQHARVDVEPRQLLVERVLECRARRPASAPSEVSLPLNCRAAASRPRACPSPRATRPRSGRCRRGSTCTCRGSSPGRARSCATIVSVSTIAASTPRMTTRREVLCTSSQPSRHSTAFHRTTKLVYGRAFSFVQSPRRLPRTSSSSASASRRAPSHVHDHGPVVGIRRRRRSRPCRSSACAVARHLLGHLVAGCLVVGLPCSRTQGRRVPAAGAIFVAGSSASSLVMHWVWLHRRHLHRRHAGHLHLDRDFPLPSRRGPPVVRIASRRSRQRQPLTRPLQASFDSSCCRTSVTHARDDAAAWRTSRR